MRGRAADEPQDLGFHVALQATAVSVDVRAPAAEALSGGQPSPRTRCNVPVCGQVLIAGGPAGGAGFAGAQQALAQLGLLLGAWIPAGDVGQLLE